MDTVVEITLVSGLREVVLHGVTEIAWERLLAVSAFVLCLGLLLRFAIHRLPEPNRPGSKGFWNYREIKQSKSPE
ncbi:MAG: phosphate-starvation-inducible PsiE family protein [Chloroflexi bacterium]|nr:phosphate-starvation-inducible PsiE family protein [Chloroflexota bacterium]